MSLAAASPMRIILLCEWVSIVASPSSDFFSLCSFLEGKYDHLLLCFSSFNVFVVLYIILFATMLKMGKK